MKMNISFSFDYQQKEMPPNKQILKYLLSLKAWIITTNKVKNLKVSGGSD